MATQAQIIANQANSLLSTGPATAAGKAASSMNHLKHGLRSSKIVLPGEDIAEYEYLRDRYIEENRPNGEQELFCVMEMVNAQWRLQRVEAAEHRLLSSDPDAIINGSLDKLERYRTSITRSYHKAYDQLSKMRKETERQQKQQKKEYYAQLDADLKAYIFAPMPTAAPSQDISDDELEQLTRPALASNGRAA